MFFSCPLLEGPYVTPLRFYPVSDGPEKLDLPAVCASFEGLTGWDRSRFLRFDVKQEAAQNKDRLPQSDPGSVAPLLKGKNPANGLELELCGKD